MDMLQAGGTGGAPSVASTPTASAPKTLVIAEKRSVGRTLAQFLGCREDHGSWIGGAQYDVTWAQGHLLRLLMPDEYDDHPQWRERGTDALPIVPPPDGWRWSVSRERGADAQYQVVAGLLGSGGYGRVVNACDPDREGQCICDLVLWFTGCRLPVDRLWCSSLEDAALAKAWARMKADAEYAGLFRSAVARSQADWLVGMNASRLYSASMHAAASVGRVRTPTLALVVERDRLIESFKGKDSYRVRLDLGSGFWVTGEPGHDAAQADAVLASAQGKPCHITSVERKRAREGAPALLNTTGAQKLASERLGMSPDAVDRALQSLYEKKLATYPRTDSRYVNAEDGAALPALIAAIADEAHVGAPMAQAFAVLPHDVGKVVDDAKVEGHGALLPTRSLTAAKLAALPPEEASVARLLCESLLMAVSPDRVYDHVEVKASCEERPYTASSNTDVEKGWRILRAAAGKGDGAEPAGASDDGGSTARGAAAGSSSAALATSRVPETSEGRSGLPNSSAPGQGAPKRSRRKDTASDDDAATPDDAKTCIPAGLTAPADFTVLGGEVKKTKATPPKRYTDATLLAAMEHADRFVEEDELKAAIKDSSAHSGGIGTPATRAGIIASLVERGYLERKRSTLTSTAEGRALVDEVAPELKSVELTARIERDLNSVHRENADPAPFIAAIVQMVQGIVAAQRVRPVRTALPKGAPVGKCPACGGSVLDTGNERAPYVCEHSRRERVENPDGTATWRDCGTCSFRLRRDYMGAPISSAAAKKLLAGKSVMLKGMVRKDGTKIDRLVELDPAQGWRPRIAADQRVKVGVCPACGGAVYDVGNERVPFLCEHNQGNGRRGVAGDAGRAAGADASQAGATSAAVATSGNGGTGVSADASAAGVTPGANAVAGAPSAPASCDFKLYREYLGKKLAKTEVAALLKGETVTVKGLTSKKTGEKFNAFLALDPQADWRPRITGYPAEQPAKKSPKQPAEKPAKAARPSNQATLPGLEW